MTVVDSGVIYECVRLAKTRPLTGQYTTSLALFELGNIVWKNSVLVRTYSQKDACQLLSGCEIVIEKMRVSYSNLEHIYQLSARHHISFYDAAYVCLARDLKVPLVTLDIKLTQKIGSAVDILPFDQFISK